MKVLLATTAGVGHCYPLIPLAWAAQRGGHDVRVAAPPQLTDALASRGLPHAPLPDLSTRHMDRIMAVMRAMEVPATREQEQRFVRENFGWAKTDATLERMRQLVADWRPDLVLHEAFEFASMLAAEEAGVPHATVSIGVRDLVLTWLPDVAAGAGELAGNLGLDGDLAQAALGAPLLTMVPPLLDTPADGAQVLRYRAGALHPDTPRGDLAGDDPLVWVTFGTEAWRVPGALNDVLPALRAAAKALPRVRFLVTTGSPDLAPDGMPANVRCEAYVPQEHVLADCAAVVHHCGFNTTMATVTQGRPSVALPLFSADQFANAAALDAQGAALWLRQTNSDALRDAILAVLHEPAHADAAGALAREIATLPSADEALATLIAS